MSRSRKATSFAYCSEAVSTLKRKLLDIENDIRHSLKVFGLMAGTRVQRASFEARVRELVALDALIAGVTECMLRAWAALWNAYKKFALR